MSRKGSLEIAIDVPVWPGSSGGVATFIMSLIRSLGELDDGSEAYKIIVRGNDQIDWLKPYMGPNQKFVLWEHFGESPTPRIGTRTNGQVGFSDWVKIPVAKYYLQKFLGAPLSWNLREVPISDGLYESLGCDVLHIPSQRFVLCSLPTIYNPHDLQHLHYPEFFSPETLSWRETAYPAGCYFAHTVAVGSQWVKDDVVRQYRLKPEKICVIPEGPPTSLYAEPAPDFVTKVQSKYRLQQPFAFYPAVTWPHKNHIRLLEAMACLRDKYGVAIQLVCTGSKEGDFLRAIETRMDELNLRSQVKFLGFVSEQELRAIYRLSQFLVLPSLFEAISLPVFEAWLDGVPVACSNATAIPDQVGDAALLFDPNDVESIADAVGKLATDADLREMLGKRGRRRLGNFGWERTARAYRAVYRRAARVPLMEEDRRLLAWDRVQERRDSGN
jgi:glycosyltransferase involved in cell wall biosynthesis